MVKKKQNKTKTLLQKPFPTFVNDC